MKKLFFILNPKAGVPSKVTYKKLIDSYLNNCFKYSIVTTSYAGHATKLAKEAIEQGYDAVIGIGGDGTINEIAQATNKTNIPLGIIPSGSGNGLARHLKIPLSTKAALDKINKFRLISIDTGLLNDHIFLCTAGTGFEGLISKSFTKSKKRGFLSYCKLIMKHFRTFDGFTVNNGVNKILTLCIANIAQYGNNVFIAPEASAVDGYLNMIELKKTDVLSSLKVIFQLFNGRINNNKNYKNKLVKQTRFSLNNAEPTHVDGEYIGEIDFFTIKIQEASLKVIS